MSSVSTAYHSHLLCRGATTCHSFGCFTPANQLSLSLFSHLCIPLSFSWLLYNDPMPTRHYATCTPLSISWSLHPGRILPLHATLVFTASSPPHRTTPHATILHAALIFMVSSPFAPDSLSPSNLHTTLNFADNSPSDFVGDEYVPCVPLSFSRPLHHINHNPISAKSLP